jgi:hypothetical protein
MELIGYSSYFTKIEQFQEGGGDNLDIPEIATDQVSDNMEELISTNEGYRQHGREVADKNPSSPNNSQKSTPSRTKYRTSGIEMRKASAGGSDDGGDKDPPRKNLENPILCIPLLKEK